jgi:hypothetical protein
MCSHWLKFLKSSCQKPLSQLNHPMIVPAKSQFNWLYWFLTRRFLKFRPIRTHYGPWQPCWFFDQCQKQKSCILKVFSDETS